MLTVETICKIRLSVHREGKSIRRTAKDLHLSRNTVRKAIRDQETAFHYKRSTQPRPRLDPFVESLEGRLQEDKKLPKRYRRTAQVLFEELQLEGYKGGYDSVRRYVQQWRRGQKILSEQVFIPMVFDPGEALQLDWSHEWLRWQVCP